MPDGINSKEEHEEYLKAIGFHKYFMEKLEVWLLEEVEQHKSAEEGAVDCRNWNGAQRNSTARKSYEKVLIKMAQIKAL